jgi:hypothetical protein
MITAAKWITWALLLLVLAGAASAQEPRLDNAQLERRAVAGKLETEFRALAGAQVEPAWIGWAARMEGEHQMCCWSNTESARGCCSGCRLEGGSSEGVNISNDRRTVKLEGPQWMLMLLRVENRAVTKLRVFSEDCAMDAGGRKVFWLTGASGAESVGVLRTFVRETGRSEDERPARKMADGAVMAIALHADPAAERALNEFVAVGQPQKVREQAIFWLGSARCKSGFTRLKQLVRDDPSDAIREKTIFALHICKEDAAVEEIIRSAKEDRSARVRGQALFWLAQRAGAKAAAAISEAIENDPETDVKKKAVFALSQMPKDQGVPKLIEVARTNRNPAVRKQAMFWLGQSNDPRAVAFFEEVLKK